MARKSSDLSSLIGVIAAMIGIIFIIIRYSITFLEKVNKYHQWTKFWITFPFLCLTNYLGYIYLNKSSDIAIIIFAVSWASFIIYWSIVLGNAVDIENQKIRSQKEEIIEQLGVTSPNCPYCGETLKKMPMRKTRCPQCGEFIYVRTNPKNNKTYLVQEDNVQELEAQWKNSKSNKELAVIDVSNEMNEVLKYLTLNYQNYCNYPQILQIKEDERLKIMQYMWKHWDIRINDKEMKKVFPEYNKILLNEIRDIEENRRYTYFKIQEFQERVQGKQPLIKIGWLPLDYGMTQGICTIDTMIKVFEWYLKQYDEGVNFPNYIEMPFTYFLADIPECKMALFRDDDFQVVTLKELKEFCRKNNYGYPYEK